MIYVGLLRGINVGGKTRVEMSRLKTVFEAVGCTRVVTYINSGNVVFSSNVAPVKLTELLTTAIQKEFDLEIPIVLRSQANINELCSNIPAEWTNDAKQRTDVMFLWDEIDDPSALEKVVIKPEIENVRYIDGALVWNTARENVRRGGMAKLIGNAIYKQMTIRNINTVRKLCALMDSVT